MSSISSSAAPGPQNSRATRRLTSSTHQRSGVPMADSGSMKGVSAITGSWSTGSEQLEDLEEVERRSR